MLAKTPMLGNALSSVTDEFPGMLGQFNAAFDFLPLRPFREAYPTRFAFTQEFLFLDGFG
jgi:hypothetical protein